MPERIRGITVEIGGDTSGLSKALKNSNKEIKNTQTQLKDVEKLLKLDPTNIDLLRQREKLLNDAVRETGDKLNSLKEIQRNMDANGVDKNSEQYMALQREIIATEQELGNLRTAARDSNATLSQIGAVADSVAEKTDKLAQKTAGLSVAAAGTLAALGKAAYDVVLASDDLNTASKQSGFSTATLQEFEYAADRMDVSTETIIGAGRKLKKNMVSTSKETQGAFETLGVSVTNADGTVRDSQEVFWECVEALGNIEDETQRDVIAMQIFGKSADDLAGLIDDGGEAFLGYAKEAEELGLVLDQDTLDSLNAVNDEIDKLKTMLKATFAKTGAKLVSKLTPVFEKLAAKIEKVVEWVANLSDEQLWTFVKILAGVAALSPTLKFFSKLASGVSAVTKALKVIKPAMTAFNAVLAANPIVLVVAAIAALIYACVKFKDEICGAIDKVTAWLHDKLEKDWTEVFGPVLGGVLNFFSKGFLKFWDGLSDLVKTGVSLIHDIFTGDWEGVWNTASKAVTNACAKWEGKLESFDGFMNRTFTTDWRDKFGDRLGGWMNTASSSILDTWNNTLKPGLDGVLTWVKDTFSGDWEHAWTNIKCLGSNAWGAIKNGWDNTLQPKLDACKTWITDTFATSWKEQWDNIKSNAGDAWDAVKSGWEDTVQPKLNSAKDWIDRTFLDSWRTTWENAKSVATSSWDSEKSTWDNLKASFDSVTTWLGSNFTLSWSRIWGGISSAFDRLWTGLGEMAKAPLNKIIEYLNKLIGKVNGFIDTLNSLEIFGWSANIGHIADIPKLAKGGTVINGSAIVGEAGAELLTVSGGRATVTPLTKGGTATAGNTINVYAQEMTAAQVDYLIDRVNRGLGVMT